MRARRVIAGMSVPLVVVGFVLALDLPAKFGIVFSAVEWGYTLFSVGADIALVYLIIDFLLLREERRRWKAVEDKAIERVQLQLFGVFFLVFSMITPRITLSSPYEEKMSRMRELVADPDKLRTAMVTLDYRFSSYLKRSARGIGDLQLRYSSRLDPRLIDTLIDVENSLESMDSFLSTAHEFPDIVGDVREATWQPLLGLLKALVKGVDSGFIELPGTPRPT